MKSWKYLSKLDAKRGRRYNEGRDARKKGITTSHYEEGKDDQFWFMCGQADEACGVCDLRYVQESNQ